MRPGPTRAPNESDSMKPKPPKLTSRRPWLKKLTWRQPSSRSSNLLYEPLPEKLVLSLSNLRTLNANNFRNQQEWQKTTTFQSRPALNSN